MMAFELIETLTDSTKTVRSVYADENYLYAGTHDNATYVYNISDFSLKTTLIEPANYVWTVYADENYLYAGSIDTNIYVYNKSDFSLETILTDPTNFVRSICVDENRLYVGTNVGSDDTNVYVYNKSDFSLETTLTALSSIVAAQSIFADENYLYVGSNNNNTYIYSKTDFSLETTLTDSTGKINSVYADEDYLYVGADGETLIYNITDFSLKTTLTDSTGYIYSVYADDNYLYAGCSSNNVYIYNKADFSLETTLSDANSGVYSVFTDKNYLYAGLADSNVYIYQSPVSYKYAYGDILSATTESSFIEGSVNFLGSATMSVNAEILRNHKTGSVDFTGTASMSLDYIRIRNASTSITGQSTLTMRPYIIANASSNMTGQALMHVRALRLIIPEGSYEITADNYFTKNQPADSSSVANYIIVETQPLVLGETEELFSTNDPRTIEAGETIVINAEYSSKPAINCSASLSDNTANTTITKANFYACSAEIEITNEGTSPSQDSFNLAINGTSLEVSGVEKAYSQDDRSITENGEITYELPKNHLIQTKEMAQTIANKLKDSFADPKRDVSIDWRGNPALILADPVTVPEFQKLGINKIGQFYVTKQELEYSGGLRANLEGRKNENG